MRKCALAWTAIANCQYNHCAMGSGSNYIGIDIIKVTICQSQATRHRISMSTCSPKQIYMSVNLRIVFSIKYMLEQ